MKGKQKANLLQVNTKDCMCVLRVGCDMRCVESRSQLHYPTNTTQ